MPTKNTATIAIHLSYLVDRGNTKKLKTCSHHHSSCFTQQQSACFFRWANHLYSSQVRSVNFPNIDSKNRNKLEKLIKRKLIERGKIDLREMLIPYLTVGVELCEKFRQVIQVLTQHIRQQIATSFFNNLTKILEHQPNT